MTTLRYILGWMRELAISDCRRIRDIVIGRGANRRGHRLGAWLRFHRSVF